jgi:bacterioferritin
MLTGPADQGVLGYLGRALSLEFSAVQLYSTQARLVAYWGLASAAERLRHEAEEELQHTDRIIERMLALGVAPNASQLRPVKLGENLVQMLGINQRFEQELINLYYAAASYSARIGDHDSRLFFNALLEEERAHHRELLDWQAELQSGEISD